jgi:hypothetical protein
VLFVSGILSLGALGLGCRSEAPLRVPDRQDRPVRLVLNTSPPPIGVRYRLATSDVELAVLLAIANPAQVPALEPGQEITADVLPAVLGGFPQTRRAEYPWSFLKREPGLIHAVYDRGELHMLVAIMFDEQLVMLRIVDSRNFGQIGDRIHPDAFTHLIELENRIRHNIEAVAQRNWYGTPVPASR